MIFSLLCPGSLKPMGHQDDRDSNIGKKYQSTEIHSHALAVKDGECL